MTKDYDNLENGRQEIWRRQKLLIGAVMLFLPYGLFIIMPLSHFLGSWITIILIVIFGVFLYRVNEWYSNSPCPNCGKPIWSPATKKAKRYRTCIHCEIDLRPTQKPDHSISFQPITYKGGEIENNNKT